MRIHHASSSMSHPGDESIIAEGGGRIIPDISNIEEALTTTRSVRQRLEHNNCECQDNIRWKEEKEEVVKLSRKPKRCVTPLRMMLLTWNLGETSPPTEDCKFISEMAACDDIDVVCLAVQEVENIKPRRHEGRRSREWKRIQRKALGHSVSTNNDLSYLINLSLFLAVVCGVSYCFFCL